MGFLFYLSKLGIKYIFQKKDYSWLLRLWTFSLKANIFYFYLSIILMIIEVIFDTLEPQALGKLTKLMFINDIKADEISKFIFTIVFILFCNRFFEKLKDRFGDIFNKNVEVNLQKEYYVKLLEKDTEFFDKNKISNLFTILSNDINIISDITMFGFINLLKQLVQSLICVILLFTISKNLCIIICTFVPIIALLNSFKKNFILKKESENEKEEKKSHNVVLEALENMKIIKSFSTEGKEKNKYELNLANLFLTEKKIIYTCSIFETLMIILLNLLLYISVIYILYLNKGKSIEIETFTSFFLYCKIIYNGFFNVVKFSRNFNKASVLAKNFFNIMDYKPRINTYFYYFNDISSENAIKRKIDGNIDLRNINFEYEINNKENKLLQILKNIDVNIKSGSSIGIVGFSGSGKSTLINLIQRLYDINFSQEENSIIKENNFNDEEKIQLLELNNELENINVNNDIKESGIFYDNINIKNYDIKFLHNQIGFVHQEPSLFTGTIKENIIYGLENNDIIDEQKLNEEINKVLEIAQANFVFDKKLFPLGLDTYVGERGSKLSGGQKQRIAIARALIKKPKILILDEATSALDSESEYNFKKEIEKFKGKLTLIIISHRLSIIKDCEQILVINKGEIVEKGNHDELFKLKGIYYSLMEKQL